MSGAALAALLYTRGDCAPHRRDVQWNGLNMVILPARAR